MRKDFVTTNAEEPLTKVIGKMKTSGQENLFVLDDNKYVGMVSKRDMLRKNVDFRKMKARSVTAQYPVLEKTTLLADIVKGMYASNARELPVVEKGRVIGAVTVEDVIMQMKRIPGLRGLTAGEISTKNPLTLGESDTFSRAIGLMKKNNVKKLPLVDAEGTIKGILRWEDLMEAYMLQAVEKNEVYRANIRGGHTADTGSALKASVKGLTSGDYTTVTEADTLDKIVDVVRAKGAAIVARKNRLMGIITSKNLLQAFERINVVPRNVYWIHKPELDSFDAAKVETRLAELYDKLEKTLGEELKLEVHFKEFHTGGKHKETGSRKQYLLKLRLHAAGNFREVTKEDWNPLTVVQEASKALLNSVRRK